MPGQPQGRTACSSIAKINDGGRLTTVMAALTTVVVARVPGVIDLAVVPEICTSLNAARATLESQLDATERQVREFLTGASLSAALARIDAARAQGRAAVDRALAPFGRTPSASGASTATRSAGRR